MIYIPCMSKAEILTELPKLTLAEREEIRLKLAEIDGEEWLDADDPLTDAEKALIEARLEAHEKNPGTALPWEEFEARIKQRLGE
jgi:putative addiction module component (TIGR02574 family)